MKHTLFILSLLVSSLSYAQSKKELIYRVDSLNNIVALQKSDISTYKKKIDDLQTTIANLNSQVSNLTKELNLKKSEAQKQTEELAKIKEQLKVKSDSLNLVKNELDKLKPPPVKVNSAPPVANQQVGPFKTVTIGTQVWMTKNLDVATFRNGDSIPEAKTDEEWKEAEKNKQPAWCYYNNNPENGANYGKIYNLFAVYDPRGLAPAGYHIPSNDEWNKLKNFLGRDAGIKMKTNSGWYYDPKYFNGIGTNKSGFSGLPGGNRQSDGLFYFLGWGGYWWGSWPESYCCLTVSGIANVLSDGKGRGFYVRCIKD